MDGVILYAYWGIPATEGLEYTYLPQRGGYVVSRGTADTNGTVVIAEKYNDGTNGTHCVVEITYYAFCGCVNLASIVIPNSLTTINPYAFWECTNLADITLPYGVTTIGNTAFDGCLNLEKLTVASGNAKYRSDGNCIIEIATGTLIIYATASSIIPDNGSIKTIGDSAFSNCIGLTSITIPNSVTSIYSGAFYGCTSLTSITIPDGVTTIGNTAFDGCLNLEKLTVASGNAKYRSDGNCIIEIATGTLIIYATASSIIPDNGSIKTIGDSAFSNCIGLTSITIPNSVTSIYSGAFYGCTSLTSITIPDGVTSIGDGAFSGCSSLTSITYNGTKAQWFKIKKGWGWSQNTGEFTVYCDDGSLSGYESRLS